MRVVVIGVFEHVYNLVTRCFYTRLCWHSHSNHISRRPCNNPLLPSLLSFPSHRPRHCPDRSLGVQKNMASHDESEESYLDRIAPKGLKEFDAFPKLPSTYKEQSGSRGLITILIGLLAFIFVLNDIGEYIWGWPSYTFNVEHNTSNFMDVNVDVIVNMPCGCECYLFSLFENFKH